ncbi:vacuolar sorting protein 39 domain 1-domain-containing protein [Chiua virens]|nr:vacuolar sorting protein 39 domain 1-domain-containing protein [Chiua virens]
MPRQRTKPAESPLSGGFSDEIEREHELIPIPTMVTTLIVGCRRKVVLYTWKDGEAQEVKETPLPHSPRAIAFLDPSHACFAYSLTDYAIFSLEDSTVVDVTLPAPVPTAPSSTGLGMGTFSGLSSYMSLGLGGKGAKPGLTRIGDGEVVVVKENQGFIIDADAKMKGNSITWSTQPEEIAFVNPYIFSILPPGTVPVTVESSSSASNISLPTNSSSLPQEAAQTQQTFIQAPVLQIISSINMLPVQTIAFPFPQAAVANATNSSLRLLTVNIGSTHPSATFATTLEIPSHLFLISTPLDRTLATSEGTSVWKFAMRDWDTQIDELVSQASYAEALALLDHVHGSSPSPKRTLILALNAVSQFRCGKYDDAINTFLDLDVNPAKVVALFPNKVAGRLAVKQEDWVALFGGPVSQSTEQSGGVNGTEDAMSTKSTDGGIKDTAGASKDKLQVAISRSPSPAGSLRARTKTTFGSLLPSSMAFKDDDVASLSGKKKGKVVDNATRSLETLWRYLTSLRPKLAGALASHQITPSQSHLFPTLSSTSPTALYALPSGVSLTDLTKDELVKRAQIVDTALFKSYLIGRPSMLGPLCRLPNWCEVEEVEEELRARDKHAELVFLYNGRKMHAKALKLLQQLSENEGDMRDKLGPSISYLQKLGPEYLDQIFESARWVFEQDRDMAFQIFTSDDVELPRGLVTDYLKKFDPQVAARYLEYLIDEKEERSASFHDRLAELYLGITMTARKKGDEGKRAEVYAKLLKFIDTTEHYQPDRLYGLLSEDLYEARAILLGRMERHEHALELYVYKLGDFAKAEEHCKRTSSSAPTPSPIFLTLLKLYLRPTIPNPPNLLSPALSLISRHSARLDPIETLQLLPPLVNAQDVRPFLVQSLRAPVFDNCVVREVSLARKEGVEMHLMKLESMRIKMTDSRICPQCHKRLGNSVIAVHAPRGEVTHYQCREAFARKLNAVRQG